MRTWRGLALVLCLISSPVYAIGTLPDGSVLSYPSGWTLTDQGLQGGLANPAQNFPNTNPVVGGPNGPTVNQKIPVSVKTPTGTASGSLDWKIPVGVQRAANVVKAIANRIAIPLVAVDIIQALTDSGISVDPNGNATKPDSGIHWTDHGNGFCDAGCDTAQQVCEQAGAKVGQSLHFQADNPPFMQFYGTPGWAMITAAGTCINAGYQIYAWPRQYDCSGSTYIWTNVGCSSGAKPSVPATQAQKEAAIDAAAQDPNRLANMLKNGLDAGEPLPADTPVEPTPPTTITSPGAEVSRTTDSAGNVTTQTRTDSVTVSPPATVGAPAPVSTSSTLQTKTNGQPTGTTTTTTSNSSPGSVQSGTSTAIQPVGAGGPPEQKTDCDKYPNSVGCADWGTPDDPALPNKDIAVLVTPVDFSGAGVCPAPRTVAISGFSLNLSYQPFCDFAGYVRPAVLALAWLAAAFIVFGRVGE